ncbi:EthD family reductase [Rhodococcus sp. BP-252]|uniref:EthD family reductase n=1 Tax=unclassified Rhodococcus (in: high G+C Gram-positive bacteria) TaxID=192944 RepID=UPI001C9A9FCB|nr:MULTISPECIES: EthD family reductase [unclassified Rhodococcus (in: high G+C Gram-positive bacteria)]MBY6412829.1 EthD family reductase [Rhodococcus sp. BP-320]MBY6417634.1 EthD family reductase [Rhodococcus sp. BP-321]MBY6423486.1 EthD family reductase [Rhodococcus sp. BP-324]MBY6427658.1 EthD family reductase [Rhodococcus sp. BP-323]MBY6432822.1 EthD family reductase [Rhodococcus sp. BP-322]
MSFRVAVCYGKPVEAMAFDDYYTRVHIPLAKEVPGLTRFTWGKVSSLDGSEPPYYAVANLYFADRDSLDSGLASPEMRAAGKDVRNFATGGVTMFVQEEVEVQ